MQETEHSRSIFRRYVGAFAYPNPQGYEQAVREFFADDADINIVHPFNQISGVEGYLESFLHPLMESFDRPYRRDYIFMAGMYEGQEWVTSTGYLCGCFVKDWLGIKASNEMAYIRFGEFHRMVDGKAVESRIYLDIPELMIARGQWPIKGSPGVKRGYTGFLPGPATQDGLLFEPQEEAESTKSFQIVSDMLLQLATRDEAWRPYWHDNMIWYGPAAFGSFVGVEDFADFQVPFENAFSHWLGGSKPESETRHFTRFGDGMYTASGGWPSLKAHQVEVFLDQPPANKTLYMRVCDWWRRDGDLLVENWVFVDIPHVLLQMDYNVFDVIKKQA